MPTFSRSISLSSSILKALGAVALLSTLTGCGIGMQDTTVPDVPYHTFTISGEAHGGETPIIYDNIAFYETASTGVATNGVYVPSTPLTALGSTYTDINGNFTFSPSLSCTTSTDYVYAVGTGGNTGSYPGTLNPNSMIMAAVGLCSTLNSSTYVVINEESTVAAAYALQAFSSISGSYTSSTAASPVVTSYTVTSNVATLTFASSVTLASGQPITFSSFTGSDTFLNGSYFVISATSTTANIAVSNANVGPVTPVGTPTGTITSITAVPTVSVTASTTNYVTGAANGSSAAGMAHGFANAATLYSVSTGAVNTTSPNNTAVTVPLTLINSIANSLQYCVNSTGGSATSSTVNDGTHCGKLFSYTTNVSGSNQVVPSNTLQAALNIARFPTQNVSSIFGLGSGMPAFATALGTTPTDFSLALAFTKGAGGSASTGLIYPYSLALDGNDNVYVMNSNASATTQSNIVAFNNNGTTIYATGVDTTTVTAPRYIAADGSGNLFISNNGGSTTSSIVQVYAASNGAVGQKISPGVINAWGVALDSSGNLWIGFGGTSPALAEYSYSSSTWSADTLGATPTGTNFSYQIVPDKNGNIWAAQFNSTTANLPIVVPYSSGYGTATVTASGTTEKSSYGLVVDSSGNGWYLGTADINKLTASYSGSVVTAIVSSTAATYTPASGTAGLRYMAIDGNNTLWTEDINSSTSNYAAVGYKTTALSPTPFRLKPCIANSGTTCPSASSSTAGIYGARIPVVDSSGDVWYASATNGEVVEFIGLAAPSWPLLAVSKPGVMP